MLILTIRTDKPESELGLYDGQTQLNYHKWAAHRQLAETIHSKINELLKNQSKQLSQLEGIVFYSGPGSFTGLRIGASVANTLAYSLDVPIIGTSGDGWLKDGTQKLQSGQNDKIILPKYGQPAATTQPKK